MPVVAISNGIYRGKQEDHHASTPDHTAAAALVRRRDSPPRSPISTGRAVMVPDRIRPCAARRATRRRPARSHRPRSHGRLAWTVVRRCESVAPDSANHPRIPRLTGRDDVTDKIKALKPDLIIDYGEVTPRYFDLAQATQQKTGIPTLLFAGTLDNIPRVRSSVGRYSPP